MEDDRLQIAPDDGAPELTEQRFAANLRAIREERGLSQGRLADEMAARGWPWRQQTVTRVETGRRMVRLGEAKAVAEILETSLDMLTMRTDEARTIEYLADQIRRVKASYRLIAGATNELLQARETLQTNPVVIADDPAESTRVRELIAEAREVQQLTPEGAVAQGVAMREGTASNIGEWTISALRGTPADLTPRAAPAEGVVPDGSR